MRKLVAALGVVVSVAAFNLGYATLKCTCECPKLTGYWNVNVDWSKAVQNDITYTVNEENR